MYGMKTRMMTSMNTKERIKELESKLIQVSTWMTDNLKGVEQRKLARSGMATAFNSEEFTVDFLQFHVDHENIIRAILIQRSATAKRYPNYWAIPGGHLNRGEHPAIGALREFAEETGMSAGNDVQFIGQYDIEDYYPTLLYASVVRGGTIQEFVSDAKAADDAQDVYAFSVHERDGVFTPVMDLDMKFGTNHIYIFNEAYRALFS